MKNKLSLFLCFGLLATLFSCSREYYSMADFNSVEKIDTHTHLNSENTAFAQQAKADNFRLIAINVDVPEYPILEKQREYAAIYQKQYPNQVEWITAFTLQNWNSPNWADETIAQLKTDFANGALGIKIWKNIGMTYKDSAGNFIKIDNPKFDKVIKYVISQGKTVLGHLGEPKNCWLPINQMTVKNDQEYFKNHPEFHMFLHPENPSYDVLIASRDHFVARHPDMRFVGAHLGSLEWSVDELAKRLDKFPNMAVDMADRICHLQYQSKKDREKVRNFIIKYQDRLIYATDAWINEKTDTTKAKKELHETWLQDWEYFVTDDKMTVKRVDGEFEGLKLPKEVVNKIFHDNAVRWYKIKD